MNEFKRSKSICQDIRELILQYVRYNDIEKLEELLTERPDLINKADFPKFPKKPILYIACKDLADTVHGETVKKLIELGADLQYTDNYHRNRQAIHFATLGQNPEILKSIVDFVDVNATDSYGNTPLLLLYKDGKEYNRTECANVLLDSPSIDVNKTNKNNVSIIFWVAKKADIKIINRLLEHSNIDLDNYSQDGKTARDYIRDLGISVDHIPRVQISSQDQLQQYLINRDEEGFINFYESMSQVSNNYLSQAVDKNLVKVVKHLLGLGVNPNNGADGKSPLLIAAIRGYHKCFKLLVEDERVSVTDDVLFEILRYIDVEATEDSDRRLCFKYLMETKKVKRFNMKDSKGNYPLHYAGKYGGSEEASEVLKGGASLANKNWGNQLCVSDLDFDTLKKHFDNCIQAQPDNQLDKENLTISFDYSSLLPNRDENFGDEEVGSTGDKIAVETDVVLFMSKSSEFRELLQHPLIKSFLYMKWHTISWIFYTNLIFYLFFCLSLILYVMSEGSSFTTVFLFIMNTLLALRELFQVFVSIKKYFTNFENYLECILIVIVYIFIFLPNKDDATVRQLTSIVTLLTTFELLFLFGNFPALTTNIVMLRRVSLNFFKFFGFYFILIIAFAFCFHNLFNNPDPKADQSFVNPITSIFKTIIMLTGEFEAGEIEFDNYPGTSHLIFLLFVITIAVILLNLVNGLAVSDTQEIKTEAELVGLIARAEYVAHAESMFFGLSLPNYIYKLYSNWCSCRPKRKYKRFLFASFAEQRICLYPKFLEGRKLVVFPNQNCKVKLGDGKSGCCDNIYMDKGIVRKARMLIQRRTKEEREENFRMKLMSALEKLNIL